MSPLATGTGGKAVESQPLETLENAPEKAKRRAGPPSVGIHSLGDHGLAGCAVLHFPCDLGGATTDEHTFATVALRNVLGVVGFGQPL